jgi:hypothetical protein
MASKKKSTKITKTEMKTRTVFCKSCPLARHKGNWGICKLGDFPRAKNCPLAKLVYAQQVEEENPVLL